MKRPGSPGRFFAAGRGRTRTNQYVVGIAIDMLSVSPLSRKAKIVPYRSGSRCEQSRPGENKKKNRDRTCADIGRDLFRAQCLAGFSPMPAQFAALDVFEKNSRASFKSICVERTGFAWLLLAGATKENPHEACL